MADNLRSPPDSASSRPYASRPGTALKRPWTAQSRPNTARPTTAASTRYEASYITAVLEGRGVSREIGIAALDRDTGKVVMVQLADCQTYVKTLHQLHLHRPSLVLVPDTFLSGYNKAGTENRGRLGSNSSLLVDIIQDEFPEVPVEPVGRKYWNDTGGLEFIMQLCVEDDERAATLLAVSNKYYALSATCALFKHVEARLNTRFAAGSLRIRYIPLDGTMMVDPDTAKNLELVGNLTHKKSIYSLFGTLNFTFTAMGARLLRVNILSPITVQAAVDARLDTVEELVQAEERYTGVRDALKALNKMDFDKLIVSLASQEVRIVNTAKPAAARISQMLNLRNIVKSLPLLQRALEHSHSQLLQIVYELISDERLAKIEALVNESLNEESVPAKGGIGVVNARIYAVRANRNRLLDVARETYKENVGDIFELARSLAESHELPISTVYQESGFVFTLKKSEHDGDLPKGFINVTSKKGKWYFSSLDLKKMNARMKDAMDETLILSEKIIQDLVAEIVSDIGALYKASEAVALIDMLWSFAHASIMRAYTRPEFTGTLAIKSGRHTILETVQSAGTLVPNDVYCDESTSFQIIQGPKQEKLLLNMSGKSTYLKQVGLLTVMAMCGCFVPAEYASFRLHDSLLTRLSNDDDTEKCLSTFASEMATSAMILGLATSKSLILVDELGRGTSPREGIGIAHAIAEELISLKPFVFFATYDPSLLVEEQSLNRLQTLQRTHNHTFKTTYSYQSPSLGAEMSPKIQQYWDDILLQVSVVEFLLLTLNHAFRIIDGTPEDGLDLARLADLPKDVLSEAKRVAEALVALHEKDESESVSSRIALQRRAVLRLRTQLMQAYKYSALPDQELLEYIKRFQDDIAKVFLHAD